MSRLPHLKAASVLSLGISIFFFIPPERKVLAAQEPVMRVLLKEARQIRLRSNGNSLLRIKGNGFRKKKSRILNLKIKDGFLRCSVGSDSDQWFDLPLNTTLRVRSFDPRGVWLGKRRYGGRLEISIIGNKLGVVNYLGVEKYLKSVVGSEMPKSWPIEALKAQAVASRTYALKQVKKSKSYDVRSTEKNQVYLGIESETQSTKRAVNSTRSLVLIHKGKLISAVFHSSSGGETEASGSVWKYQLPYLINVPDYDQHSPKFKWEMRYSPLQLKKSFPEVGGLNSIQVLNKSRTERILKVRVYGPSGFLTLTGKELRKRLNLKSTRAKFEIISLPSKPIAQPEDNYTMIGEEKLPPLPLPPKDYTLLVKGFGAGHGVGMSQWGAHGMAMKGAGFRDILRHYYRGVKIRPY